MSRSERSGAHRVRGVWLFVAGLCCVAGARACTMTVSGRKATADGSILVSHADDAGGGTADLRLVRIPAADYPEGAMRPVYEFNGGYPRLVALDRGPGYQPCAAVSETCFGVSPSQPIDDGVAFKPLGYIPQVRHTFAYWAQDYGLINEKQLLIGESTCNARTVGWSAARADGKNWFGIDELTNVALERCETARCAIKTMGELAVKHGFFSADSGTPGAPGYDDSAECLGIADASGEAWVFNILTGSAHASAIWAAQRVPDDEVHVTANSFTIRHIGSDPDWFMHSPGVEEVARHEGWWKPDRDGPFDFFKAYGDPGKSPWYVGRRMWRVYDLVAPSLKLDADVGMRQAVPYYPFSVKPDTPVTLALVKRIHRDFYEGTPFDLTKGVGAGPFASPVRYDTDAQGIAGEWERPISIYRQAFSFIGEVRPHLPAGFGGRVWYGQDAAHGTVYIPFYAGQYEVPVTYGRRAGRQSVFQRGSSWWAFNFVNNWSYKMYSFMRVDIEEEQTRLEREGDSAALDAEALALAAYKNGRPEAHGAVAHREGELRANAIVTTMSLKHAETVVAAWWALADRLVAKYSNGYVTHGEGGDQQEQPGYPRKWLERTNFAYAKWHPEPRFPTQKHDAGMKVPRLATAKGKHESHHREAATALDVASALSTPAAPAKATTAHGLTVSVLYLLTSFVLGAAVAFAFVVYAGRKSPSTPGVGTLSWFRDALGLRSAGAHEYEAIQRDSNAAYYYRADVELDADE